MLWVAWSRLAAKTCAPASTVDQAPALSAVLAATVVSLAAATVSTAASTGAASTVEEAPAAFASVAVSVSPNTEPPQPATSMPATSTRLSERRGAKLRIGYLPMVLQIRCPVVLILPRAGKRAWCLGGATGTSDSPQTPWQRYLTTVLPSKCSMPLRYVMTSSTPITSPNLASMSNRFHSTTPATRSPTHSRGTIGRKP